MASSRYRVHDLLPELDKRGWATATLRPSTARTRRVSGFVADAARASRGCDVLLVQRPGRRREEAVLLRAAAARAQVVALDVDDPVDDVGVFRWALSRADVLLGGSAAVLDRYAERVPVAEWVPTALDFARYARPVSRLGPSGPVVGFVGDGPAYAASLTRMVAVVAATDIPVAFRIVGTLGDTGLESALRRAAAAWPIDMIQSVSWETEDVVADAVASFDIGLAPFRDSEGGSLKTVQYLAAGTVPLVEAGGEAERHVRAVYREDVPVVAPGDVDAVRGLLERFADPIARDAVAGRVRERARSLYDREVIAERIDRILRVALHEA